MRQAMAGLTLLAMALFFVSPAVAEVSAVQASTLVIRGMTPGSGEEVQKKLEALPGVAQVKVSEEEGLAEFTRALQVAGTLATYAKAWKCIVDGSTPEAVS